MTKAEAGTNQGGGGRGRYDWTTPQGRASLDDAVRSILSKVPRSRGEIGEALGMDMGERRAAAAVTAALGRLCVANVADPQGDLGRRRYVRAAKGGGR